MRRLRTHELCPLHKKFNCCGRESVVDGRPARKFKAQSADVKIIEDSHHPRGFREKCSMREIRKRKMEMLKRGDKNCMHCGKPLEDFRDIVVGHYESKGHGGARHDDHRSNIGLSHSVCNILNGSKRVAA